MSNGFYRARTLRSLPIFRLKRSGLRLLLIAVIAIGIHYLLYIEGLVRTSPTNMEVLIQVAPVLMGLGAIAIFKERYTRNQWVGVGVLTLGFTLFFHEQLQLLITSSSHYLIGSRLIVLAAFVWAIYTLAQKQLLQQLSSEQSMLSAYRACTLLYSFVADPRQLLRLNLLDWGILIFSGLSTVISYGAFVESLDHWEASKISAVHSLSPIITLGATWVISWIVLGSIPSEHIAVMGFLGVVLVIAGSAMTALGRSEKQSG